MLPWVYPSGCGSSIRAGKKLKLKKIATVFAGVFFVAIFLLLAQTVLAQVADQAELNFGLQPVEQSIGLGGEDIRLIIARIIRAVLGLLGIIAICLMLWAGYTIMTAGGNEEKIAEGKKILINTVIGLAIILSAFAIVQFVINSLVKATGIGGTETMSKPVIETFAGSGALGKIIKDHYPDRDQKDVPRNSKIIITFAEPMDPKSFIDDTNKNGIYGDCLLNKPDFKWDIDCDRLLIKEGQDVQNFHIYKSTDAQKTPVTAAAMASYNEKKQADTFVFKPLEPLGDNLEKVWYTVRLDNNVKKLNGDGAFYKQHYGFYQWEFQTDTIFDFAPPYVLSVYPKKNTTAPRNSIIQVNFNEAMDPMVVQGVASGAKGAFTHMLLNFGKEKFNDKFVTGEWKVANGYKTVEFVSDLACGENSCGQTMFCLPVDCPKDDHDCVNYYALLARTGQHLTGGQTFEAIPFSGVMDVSGNALDGDHDGKYTAPAPMVGDFKIITSAEMSPDNYSSPFKVMNIIDRVAPYIMKVSPGLDESAVKEDAQVEINFSKLMWLSTIKDIVLHEYPEAKVKNDKEVEVAVDFSFVVQSSLDKEQTTSWIKHRKFGPNGKDYYYFPEIPGTVKNVNQNCLYPGWGPGVSDVSQTGTSPVCSLNDFDEFGVPGIKGKNCVPVNYDATTDTGCVQTIAQKIDGKILQVSSSTVNCLNYLQLETISPPFQGQ